MENPLFDGEGVEFHHLQRMRQIELQKKTNDLLEAGSGGKSKKSTSRSAGEGSLFEQLGLVLFVLLWAVIGGGSYLLGIPSAWTKDNTYYLQTAGIAWVLLSLAYIAVEDSRQNGVFMLAIAAAVYGSIAWYF